MPWIRARTARTHGFDYSVSMPNDMTRRTALGLGAGAAAFALTPPATAFAAGSEVDERDPVKRIRKVYEKRKAEAGGEWHSHIAMVGADGALQTVVDDTADTVTNGYSVQKIAVAMAVMDKVDRGLLTLGQRLDLQ